MKTLHSNFNKFHRDFDANMAGYLKEYPYLKVWFIFTILISTLITINLFPFLGLDNILVLISTSIVVYFIVFHIAIFLFFLYTRSHDEYV